MKLGQLIEFAAIVSADSPNLIEASFPISEESLQRYGHWSQLRFRDWLSTLDELPRRITEALAEKRADIWKNAEPVLIDVLGGCLIARVWGSILTACDRTRRSVSAERTARDVLAEQSVAQQRVLRLMVDGPYLTLERVVALDRTRRRIERWTDLLAGHVIRRYGLADFAFEIDRALDFGEEQLASGGARWESIWELYFVCLRSNFPDMSLPGGIQAEWRDQVFRSILHSLSGVLFIDDGRLRSVRLQRLLNASILPEGPPPAGSLPGILPGVCYRGSAPGKSRITACRGNQESPILTYEKRRFAVDAPATAIIGLKSYGAVLRREPSRTSQAGSRQGWSCRNRMVPVWKGGGSAYVISYQPEVDCLTAVDGLQVDSPCELERNDPEMQGVISQAARKPFLDEEQSNRTRYPGLVQWSRRVAEYLRQYARVALVVRVSVSSSRIHQNEIELSQTALCGFWYQFYFWCSFKRPRGPMKRVET